MFARVGPRIQVNGGVYIRAACWSPGQGSWVRKLLQGQESDFLWCVRKFKTLTPYLTPVGNFLNSYLLNARTVFSRTFSEAQILSGLGGFHALLSEAGMSSVTAGVLMNSHGLFFEGKSAG